MIYLDNAATSYPKPKSTLKRIEYALNNCGNPGRGGHILSRNSEKLIYECRTEIAELFNEKDESNIIFTANATHSLNIAIKTIMKDGGHAVVSGYEHNSVIRPLSALPDAEFTIAYSKLFDADDAYNKICNAVTQKTKCIIINHVSNVFGNELPIQKINDFCKIKKLNLILDISQSAGNIEINLDKLDAVNFLCMPGHKGLYGPSGTGVLVCCKGFKPYSLIEGGTGSNSIDMHQPDFLPDMLESGTSNFVGIAGLLGGIEFIKTKGVGNIDAHKKELIDYFYNTFPDCKKLKLFYNKKQKSLISFSGYEFNDKLFYELSQMGICLRNGLHCSPCAHRSAETIDYGTIRVSFSAFTSKNDVNILNDALKNIIKSL